MGSYLSEPATEKESTDDTNGKLTYGASSMQGWRMTQEDAHNCILNYDEDTSFFAVYDGHGGQEVAQYCSDKLPDFIKNTPEYKEGNIEEALVSGFLRFDALIATPEVVEELRKIADDKDENESDEEENVNNLYEEAAMPIEQVIEKYTSNLSNPAVKSLKRDIKSPFLTAKTDSDPTVGTSSAGSCSSSTSQGGDGVSSSSEAGLKDKTEEENKPETNGPGEVSDEKPNSSEVKDEVGSTKDELGSTKDELPTQNGEIAPSDSEAQAKSDVTSSSTPVENGTPSKKGKGKAVIKPEPVKTPTNTRPKRTAQQLYKNWLNCGEEESDSSDEEDQTFEGPNEESSEDENEGVNIAIDAEGSEEESSEEEEEEDEDEEDDDSEDADVRTFKEEPGSDSGCTAVVALLKGNQLYVANAGDSRCIVCRNGKPIEMSIDHKPEDKPERKRIQKAGGEVTWEGRVNGGLNLSRAIGDHAYKQNKNLSDREQMITALPDIKTLTINPEEDEFMFLACDGIWNAMSNEKVVAFIRPRLQDNTKKLSQICEEMFDHILAPDTVWDNAGSDNMTAIIVKFKSHKRPISPSQTEESAAKRTKSEAESEAQVDTTV